VPHLNDLKETALYVDDLARAKSFYRNILGLKLLTDDPRFCAFDVAGKHILLLFLRNASLQETHLPGGTIPPHNAHGPAHLAFSIDQDELTAWRTHFEQHQVTVTGEVTWPRGGKSIYFNDPDGHLLELLTPGVWATY
jgi:catechol 2,3-dioxygenase-like lactoylglutathione lyase family enzyme